LKYRRPPLCARKFETSPFHSGILERRVALDQAAQAGVQDADLENFRYGSSLSLPRA